MSLTCRPARSVLSSTDVSESDNGEAAGGEATPTVWERLRGAYLSDERVRDHCEARAIELDGVVVTDLEQSAPPGSRIVFGAAAGGQQLGAFGHLALARCSIRGVGLMVPPRGGAVSSAHCTGDQWGADC